MPTVANTMRYVPTYIGPGGATAANVMHLVSIGGVFNQATCDAIATAWVNNVTRIMNENWDAVFAAEFLDLRTDPPPQVFSSGDNVNGVGSGYPLPAQVCYCLSLAAASGGRSGRGRVYVPGIGEGDVTDGSIVLSGFVTEAVDAFTDYATGCSAVGWVPAVYSRTDGVSRIVATISGDQVIDTQRRRVQRLA